MKNAMSALIVSFGLLSLTACESTGGNVGLGVLGGAAAGAGGYELHLNNQKNRVEEDFKDKKIDEKERDIRLDQIKRDSLLQ
ncbi:MAG: hypothetical protein OEZ57_07605 [Nitrospirota bacterium]|nr:hypothetical protein [Nitrospirota bacterium]MDH5585761.1 hypothetical protein [Nitrospirota bacterium]MDH5774766.1 hypothetical protein [Nitrospirota bacterium]